MSHTKYIAITVYSNSNIATVIAFFFFFTTVNSLQYLNLHLDLMVVLFFVTFKLFFFQIKINS